MLKIIKILFIIILPINSSAQILFDACDYSHSSIFQDYNHFQKGIYASTIASKAEIVKLCDDLSYIELEGKKYRLSNPEYFSMLDMPSTEQILFDSEDAIAIGITLNGTIVTITVLYEVLNSKMHQTSYTFSNKLDAFLKIKSKIKNNYTKKTSPNSNSTFSNAAGEFLSGHTIKYLCDGSGKGLGLKFSIKYPKSWNSEKGNRPHIVQKISNDDFTTSVMLIINDLEYSPSKSEIDEFFNEDFAREMVPSGGYYIKSSNTVIDGELAMVLDYFVQREKLGSLFKIKIRMYSIIYNNYLLQVQFLVGQNPLEQPKDLNELFKEYELVFNAMINSLVIVSKWEKY